jgi:hypothetical protein
VTIICLQVKWIRVSSLISKNVKNTDLHDRIIMNSSSSIGTTTLSWVSACSTIVEHCRQEGFYIVPLPAARQTPSLEDQGFRTFQISPQEAPASKATLANPATEGGTMGEKWPRILPKVATIMNYETLIT